MLKRVLLGSGIFGVMAALAGAGAGTGCLVTLSEGSGGSGGSTTVGMGQTTVSTSGTGGMTVGVTSSTTSMMASSTTGGCVDMGGCARCNTCVTNFTCGVAATNSTLCKCNGGVGYNSLALYTQLYNCLCGNDGDSGFCGAQCSKTCRGTGTNGSGCNDCIGAAAINNNKCKASYDVCKSNL